MLEAFLKNEKTQAILKTLSTHGISLSFEDNYSIAHLNYDLFKDESANKPERIPTLATMLEFEEDKGTLGFWELIDCYDSHWSIDKSEDMTYIGRNVTCLDKFERYCEDLKRVSLKDCYKNVRPKIDLNTVMRYSVLTEQLTDWLIEFNLQNQ